MNVLKTLILAGFVATSATAANAQAITEAEAAASLGLTGEALTAALLAAGLIVVGGILVAANDDSHSTTTTTN